MHSWRSCRCVCKSGTCGCAQPGGPCEGGVNSTCPALCHRRRQQVCEQIPSARTSRSRPSSQEVGAGRVGGGRGCTRCVARLPRLRLGRPSPVPACAQGGRGRSPEAHQVGAHVAARKGVHAGPQVCGGRNCDCGWSSRGRQGGCCAGGRRRQQRGGACRRGGQGRCFAA